ncbi:hypothetical protein JYU34_004787, partial [Plutella xylostella]
MTSQRGPDDVTGPIAMEEKGDDIENKEVVELPPSGTSLHKRRRGEPPASLTVHPPCASDAEGASPRGLAPAFTPAPAPSPSDLCSEPDGPDPGALCDSMLQRLKDKNDELSKHGRDIAFKTRDTLDAMDQLEKLLDLLDQFVTLKEHNATILRRLREVEHLKRLHEARKRICIENEKLKTEEKELQLINEALDADVDLEFGQALFDSMLSGGKNMSMKRSGSKWKSHSRFRGSILRKQRSRSAGGEDSDAPPTTPLRRRSEAISSKEVDKSKVSKWTRVKAAFRWEKAQWSPGALGGAAGAVAAGALGGALALAGSAPESPAPPATPASPATPAPPAPRESSLTPGSAMSLTPNSSCEELRMDPGSCRKSVMRCDENESSYLHAPIQDDTSTSPSPNKLHRSPWGKMRDIIQTKRDSVRKKTRASKSSPDVVPLRRRSFSDGGDSDAPPALTLTIPSSEELESEPSHPVLRKQRSLELCARPPPRPTRASKWSKVKRAFLTGAVSVPSSPSRHSAFFTDAETEGLSSGCEASGFKEEIARDYAALQSRLRREFSDRQGKLYSSRPVAMEEQLSADFRKKLAAWQARRGARQPPPMPARQDLSDDFLKKWDEWKRMKEAGAAPAREDPRPDEVLVQTSTGLFKFQGISRHFTRKLHEWEKSRGIAPEASTSALLRAARAQPPALARAQSAGSVAAAGPLRRHASSLSVNDADDIDLLFDGDGQLCELDPTGSPSRSALLVEVEAEEVCTAAPLLAVTPRHQPQTPVYTYGAAEATWLCETSAAVTGTAVLQASGAVVVAGDREINMEDKSSGKSKARDQSKADKNNSKRKIHRQTSIEDDAKFIRKTIEEIERASSRYKNDEVVECTERGPRVDEEVPSTSRASEERTRDRQPTETIKKQDSVEDSNKDESKRKDGDKTNGKKKSKSRARLEREQSKPSESDTEVDVDTVTVEIPRRRKKPRRPSERPRTPPASLHTDSEEEVFVLKLKASDVREGSPEVIVKTTRKIFSPVVRSGESVPRAVIPVDVADLAEVKPSDHSTQNRSNGTKKKMDNKNNKKREEENARSKSSGDLHEGEEQRKKTRPPLPLSPSSQRKPQPKETAPSIRIMIQKYNMKMNEEGHTSGSGSGASSPAWRSPAAERRRPPDMPVGVNIRNNPFLEREVQKSASACQLSPRDHAFVDKPLTPPPPACIDGVLKSHSANALHPELNKDKQEETKDTEEAIRSRASTDTIVPDLTRNLPVFASFSDSQSTLKQSSETNHPFPLSRSETSHHFTTTTQSITNVRKTSISDMTVASFHPSEMYERSVSVAESTATVSSGDSEATARASERAARIRAARERFLASPAPMRREGTSSASDLRPGDRTSRVSEHSAPRGPEEPPLSRSASTGMVNVEREAWERLAE